MNDGMKDKYEASCISTGNYETKEEEVPLLIDKKLSSDTFSYKSPIFQPCSELFFQILFNF